MHVGHLGASSHSAFWQIIAFWQWRGGGGCVTTELFAFAKTAQLVLLLHGSSSFTQSHHAPSIFPHKPANPVLLWRPHAVSSPPFSSSSPHHPLLVVFIEWLRMHQGSSLAADWPTHVSVLALSVHSLPSLALSLLFLPVDTPLLPGFFQRQKSRCGCSHPVSSVLTIGVFQLVFSPSLTSLHLFCLSFQTLFSQVHDPFKIIVQMKFILQFVFGLKWKQGQQIFFSTFQTK